MRKAADSVARGSAEEFGVALDAGDTATGSGLGESPVEGRFQRAEERGPGVPGSRDLGGRGTADATPGLVCVPPGPPFRLSGQAGPAPDLPGLGDVKGAERRSCGGRSYLLLTSHPPPHPLGGTGPRASSPPLICPSGARTAASELAVCAPMDPHGTQRPSLGYSPVV